nr:hypothetical protein [Tanacetum cinerariifolium]
MVEDVSVVKSGKEKGVIIEDSGFSNDGGKETVVIKRAIGSRKIEEKSVKRQRIEGENVFAELKRCLEIVLDNEDDVIVEATPLSSKSPTIIDYKIYKEGRKCFFQIIIADGNSQMYLTISKCSRTLT